MKALLVAAFAALGLATVAEAFSGRNGLVAFTQFRFTREAFQTTIYTVDPETRAVKRLTRGSQSAWSPDGRSLVFVRGREPWGADVLIADLRGIVVRAAARMTGLHSGIGLPTWSPDGSQIAFIDDGILVIVDAETGERQLMKTLPRFIEVAWSPDGRLLAALAYRRVPSDPALVLRSALHVMSLEGESDFRRDAGSGLDWSPDGRILFSTDGKLALIRADGSGFTSLGIHGANGVLSPDGRMVAYDRTDNLYGTQAILLAATRRSRPRALAVPPRGVEYRDPSWQPRCTRYGRWRSDVLRGTNGFDLLCGLGGNDTVVGGRGSDRLFGEEGTTASSRATPSSTSSAAGPAGTASPQISRTSSAATARSCSAPKRPRPRRRSGGTFGRSGCMRRAGLRVSAPACR